MKSRFHRLDRSDGFTLIELLVVIAIIGVLVAIAIPTFTANEIDAAAARDKANLRGAYTVAKHDAATTGGYPGVGVLNDHFVAAGIGTTGTGVTATNITPLTLTVPRDGCTLTENDPNPGINFAGGPCDTASSSGGGGGAGPAPGSLDTSFGSSGIAATNFDEDWGAIYALAFQSDGLIVAAGQDLPTDGNSDFSLARYNTDGSLDTSFGTGGIVLTDVGGAGDLAHAVALQTNGKIVAAGYSDNDFAVVRYNADGSLDTSFGTGGIVLTDISGSFSADNAYAVGLQSDSKIVVAGSSFASSHQSIALVRYNADGSLDTSFGTGGKVTTDVGGSTTANALVLQPNGKIVIAGYSDTDFALVRYNADGSLDTSFGTGGKVTTGFGGSSIANGVSLQSDGKILAGGYSCTSSCTFALARYNANGSLDTGFGAGGKVTTVVGIDDNIFGLAVQDDGKIVVDGYSGNGSEYDFALARYNADGSLDTGFGRSGIVLTAFSPNDGTGYALGIQSDNKIIAAGTAAAPDGSADFALARYEA